MIALELGLDTGTINGMLMANQLLPPADWEATARRILLGCRLTPLQRALAVCWRSADPM